MGTIKLIDQKCLKDALRLIQLTFDEFQAPDYGPEGIAEFSQFIDYHTMQDALLNNQISLYGYFVDDTIAGVLGIRLPQHICLLFVHKNSHRKGIARQLIDFWQATLLNIDITVNASPYALEAYQKMGFVSLSDAQTIKGITFIPMTKKLK